MRCIMFRFRSMSLEPRQNRHFTAVIACNCVDLDCANITIIMNRVGDLNEDDLYN